MKGRKIALSKKGAKKSATAKQRDTKGKGALAEAARAVRSVLSPEAKRRSGSTRPAVAVSGIDTTKWEVEANSISRNIQKRHLPFGTILDPIFAAPDSEEIVNYTRAGDSAIWTGHYLAAEAFRCKVTASAEALQNVKGALAGLRSLVDVTGTGLLARALVPVDSPFAEAITREEASNGIFKGTLQGREFYWVGDTSRDQYSGALFGLGIAYEMVDDTGVRSESAQLVTRLLEFLLNHQWAVVMPDGAISTVFIGRPDQQLAFLQIGQHVNADRFAQTYQDQRNNQALLVILPIGFDVLDDHNSYFKFNLDTINLFSLIRFEGKGRFRNAYLFAYNVLRRTTDDHGNAHFNMIDRALKEPEAKRDGETIDLLARWLQRPRRDEFVDLRGKLPACGPNRACRAIPVERRVRTDFLWQRSPFLLSGGGNGLIEGPGIDFILPYWMARSYGVL